MALSDIIRTALLTAQIDGTKTIDRVEVQEIAFPANQRSPVHLHPCPVIGLVTRGTIRLEVEGQPSQEIHAGDAFFEPANTRILHFDAIDGPATFVAYYLLGQDDTELIVLLS
ncbi:MAG TPA: cupin domain-containing protein [Herpetosiphonaceae bacterium]